MVLGGTREGKKEGRAGGLRERRKKKGLLSSGRGKNGGFPGYPRKEKGKE